MPRSVSDTAAASPLDSSLDTTGPFIASSLQDPALGLFTDVKRRVVSDDLGEIRRAVEGWVSGGQGEMVEPVRLIITTGGTGMGSRDVTVEVRSLFPLTEVVGTDDLSRVGCRPSHRYSANLCRPSLSPSPRMACPRLLWQPCRIPCAASSPAPSRVDAFSLCVCPEAVEASKTGWPSWVRSWPTSCRSWIPRRRVKPSTQRSMAPESPSNPPRPLSRILRTLLPRRCLPLRSRIIAARIITPSDPTPPPTNTPLQERPSPAANANPPTR